MKRKEMSGGSRAARNAIIVGALGMLAVTAWIASSSTETSDEMPLGRTSPARSSVDPDRSWNKMLDERRLAVLEQRVKELEQARDTLEPVSDEQSSEEPSPADVMAAPPESMDSAAMEQVIAAREDALRAEQLDPTWSSETQGRFIQSFENDGFKGSSLLRAQCGSTFCVLHVSHEDEAARSEFERVASRLTGMGSEFLATQAPDGVPGTTAFFIRPGHDKPSHPARRYDI